MNKMSTAVNKRQEDKGKKKKKTKKSKKKGNLHLSWETFHWAHATGLTAFISTLKNISDQCSFRLRSWWTPVL